VIPADRDQPQSSSHTSCTLGARRQECRSSTQPVAREMLAPPREQVRRAGRPSAGRLLRFVQTGRVCRGDRRSRSRTRTGSPSSPVAAQCLCDGAAFRAASSSCLRATTSPDASRARAPLPEAESSRRLSRCARSPRRSPSSSSTSRPSRAHRDPIPESGPARPGRARAARDRHRWPVAVGFPPPRRRLGCVHRATGGSRSGRFEIGPPSGCRRRPRRQRPAGCRSGPGPASARRRRLPPGLGFGARSGSGRMPDAAAPGPPAPRRRDR
jgi:hypothetical protein